MLSEYFRVVDEMSKLSLSIGKQAQAQPTYTINLNKQMAANSSQAASLQPKVVAENVQLDNQLGTLRKQQEEKTSAIFKYLTSTYKTPMLDAVHGKRAFEWNGG